MNQITLLTGENHFAIREEKQRWKETFRAKHGEENLRVLSASSLTPRDLLEEIAVAPFIAERRLVVVEGLLKCSATEAKTIKDVIHPGVVLLFVVPLDPEKSRKPPVALKELSNISEVKRFPRLSGMEIRRWMGGILALKQAKITPEAAHLLLDIVGEDQEALLQELSKLALYAQGIIDVQHVQDLAAVSGERQIWHIMDLVSAGRSPEAVSYAESLFQRGTSPFDLWGRLLWMTSQLVLVSSALQEGVTQPFAITKQTGVPPRTVQSLLPLARRCSLPRLNAIVRRIVEFDHDLKTGALRSSDGAPEELNAVIDRVLLSFEL
ncbi:MAG: DNA polymerase III subunit delta [Candidatus Peregrinibacteria bacterium]